MEVGDQIGAYVVERRLGRGGFGETYLVADHRGARAVLKVLIEDGLDDLDAIERFRRELQACHLINSKYVARPLDSDLDASPRWITFEYVEGEDLRDAIRRGIDEDAIANILAEIAQAICDMDHHGIVHRDLKPENIRIGSASSATVIDLGLAKYSEWSTITCGPAGTWRYMAPEIVTSPDQATSACDVWALGMMVAELAGGRHPLRDFRDHQIPGLLSEGIDLPMPTLPVEWLGVARACLRPEPHFRPSPPRLKAAIEAAVLLGAPKTHSNGGLIRRDGLRHIVAIIECAPGGRTSWEVLRGLLEAGDQDALSHGLGNAGSTRTNVAIAELAVARGHAGEVADYVTDPARLGTYERSVLHFAVRAAEASDWEAMKKFLTAADQRRLTWQQLTTMRSHAESAGETAVADWLDDLEAKRGVRYPSSHTQAVERDILMLRRRISRGDVEGAVRVVSRYTGPGRWVFWSHALERCIELNRAETFCALLLRASQEEWFDALLASHFRPQHTLNSFERNSRERFIYVESEEFAGALYPLLGSLVEIEQLGNAEFDAWLRQARFIGAAYIGESQEVLAALTDPWPEPVIEHATFTAACSGHLDLAQKVFRSMPESVEKSFTAEYARGIYLGALSPVPSPPSAG